MERLTPPPASPADKTRQREAARQRRNAAISQAKAQPQAQPQPTHDPPPPQPTRRPWPFKASISSPLPCSAGSSSATTVPSPHWPSRPTSSAPCSIVCRASPPPRIGTSPGPASRTAAISCPRPPSSAPPKTSAPAATYPPSSSPNAASPTPTSAPAGQLYQAYAAWCHANGHRPLNSNQLALDWVRLGPHRTRLHGHSHWCGLRLKGLA